MGLLDTVTHHFTYTRVLRFSKGYSTTTCMLEQYVPKFEQKIVYQYALPESEKAFDTGTQHVWLK